MTSAGNKTPSTEFAAADSARAAVPDAEETTASGISQEALAVLRHDLYTLLNAIIGYCEMLLEDFKAEGPPEFLQALQSIREGGQFVHKLTIDLLSLDAPDLTRPEMDELGARFHEAAGGALQTIRKTSSLLLQATLANSDPNLKLAARELEKISDAARKLFDLEHDFAQSAAETDMETDTEDAPLVEAPPQNDSAGSTPVSDEASSPTPSSLTMSESPASGPARLLVVDDIEANRDLLSMRLKREGYEIVTASDGVEALELVSSQKFDLILLDIMMPGMDGIQVLEHLKSQSTLRHLPVIVISALDDVDNVAHCIEIGADDYLSKPFNPVLLRARIGACLEKKLLRDREILLHDELQQNFDRLREVEELRDSLIHMVVHDMRTPLSSLLAGLSTMSNAGELNEIQEECLRISLNGGRSLLAMINDLLDINKMEASALELEIEPVAVEELITASLTSVRTLAASKSQEVVPEIAPDLPLLPADRDKLQRILTNLLGNAIKFTGNNCTITLSVRPDDGGVLFTVSDPGPGIPAEDLDKIFDKFGQVRAGGGRSMRSTGLGLTFCKMAVEAHGGQIWVESEVGQGSTFAFVIPLQQK